MLTPQCPRARCSIEGLVRAACAAAALVVGAACAAGCAKPILSPNESRSPFDRYDAVRNQYAPEYVEDEYGRKRPNLRARLTPKQ